MLNGKETTAARSGKAGAAANGIFKSPLLQQNVVKEVIIEVIWFFLMGMIAGAVGTLMFLEHWGRKHMKTEKAPHDGAHEKE